MDFKLQKLKKLIDKHKIISFDIFDTLILRPYMQSQDLFAHIEQNENKSDFSSARALAVNNAIKKTNQEGVSLNEIYNEINDEYKYLEDIEKKYEIQISIPNAKLIEVFNYAKKQNKKIILTSDTDLPTETIEKILKKNKIEGYNKLYLSSATKFTKVTGNLYKHIINDLNCLPNEILHIGSDKLLDYKIAKINGLDSFLITKVCQSFFKNGANLKYKKFYLKNQSNLENSILTKMIILNSSKDNYWKRLGYDIGGAICYGFTKFVIETAKVNNLEHLLFVARDGYPLLKIFNLINYTNIKGSYFYATRQILNNEIDESYYDYYKTMVGNAKNIGVVDSIAQSFSSLRITRKVDQDNNIKCILWHVYKFAQKQAETKYCITFTNNNEQYIPKIWNLVELFMTSPEAPIENFKEGKPCYKEKINKYEAFRQKVIPDIIEGILEYTQNTIKIFGDIEVRFTAKTLSMLADTYTNNLSLFEYLNIKKIKYANDNNHSVYVPLIENKIINFIQKLYYKTKKTILLIKILPYLID